MLQLPEKYSVYHNFPSNGILLLDSGVGGLSIAYEIRKLLPSVPALSIGDQKFFPYGLKSEDFLLNRITDICGFAIENFNPAVLVIACNTASTCVLTELRAKYKIPIVGVVPPVKPAAERSQNRKIAVLCTKATSTRGYLDDLIADFAADCSVLKIACENLAELAERRLLGESVSVEDIKQDLFEMTTAGLGASVDSLVLGCTHFSVFRKEFEMIFGSNVEVYDPAIAVARQVARVYPESETHDKSLFWYLTTEENTKVSQEKLKSLGIDQVYSI